METHPLITIATVAGEGLSDEISVTKLLLTLFLVLLNGFFVAAEFAIVKVRTSQIQVQQNISKSVVDASKKIVNNLDSYLAATQLGITLASLGLGWVGESSLTPVILKGFDLLGLTGAEWHAIAKNISFPIAFVMITMMHIVFGELAPKSLAIQFPTKTTFAIALPLRIFYIIFKPVIWVMNSTANVLLKLAGIHPIHGSEIHSEEELKMIINESQEGGAIQETEGMLIQNVFEFDDRRVINVLTIKKNVSAINIETSAKDAINIAISEGYSRYPVYENSIENIKGILYTKDLFKEFINEGENVKIANILRAPIYISESTLIKNLLKKFQKKHAQLAIVTDEIGEFAGLVTLEDIVEELVGEIQDEYDNEDPIVKIVKEYTFNVNSHNTINDINRLLPFKFEESELYDTLAGLIAEKYDEAELKENDVIELEDYTGTILKMYRNSVELVQLTVKEDLLNILTEE